MRLESVQNAADQAKVAAATICGKLEAYNALPWFWSDQYDLKLQIAGLSQGFDQVVVRGDISGSRSFSAFYLKDGQLIAVDAVNSPKEFMLSKRAITNGFTPDLEKLVDSRCAIQEIFKH
nr:oxidoreductase C-terminal domain-containing protein [Pseudomaricurvus alcaniphilus]